MSKSVHNEILLFEGGVYFVYAATTRGIGLRYTMTEHEVKSQIAEIMHSG